jgi:hypothetical protein
MLAVRVRQVRGCRTELRVSPLFYQDDRISILPAPHLVFGYRCGEFGKTCALSALSALSRARELVRGKVPWPALGLWMGLARNLDADWRYFSAKKIVGGLFFTDMVEIPTAPGCGSASI